jgi:hypothetical protein
MSTFYYHYSVTVAFNRELTEDEIYDIKKKRLTFNPLDITGCLDCYTDIISVEEEDDEDLDAVIAILKPAIKF